MSPKQKSPAFQFYPKDWLGSLNICLMTFEFEGAYIRALCHAWLHGGIPNDPELLARLLGKGCSIQLATKVQAMFQPNPDNPHLLVNERLEMERAKQQLHRSKSADGGKKSAEMRAKKRETEAGHQGHLNNSLSGGCNQNPRGLKIGLQPESNVASASSIAFAFPSSTSTANHKDNTHIGYKGGVGESEGGADAPTTVNGANLTQDASEDKPAVSRRQDASSRSEGPKRAKFTPPTIEEVKLHGSKIGLPDSEAENFWHYWESAGWRRKSGMMASWTSSMVNWKSNYEKRKAPRRIEPDYRDDDIAGIEDLRKQWAEDAERVRREDEANGGFPPGWGPADDAKRAAEAAATLTAGACQK